MPVRWYDYELYDTDIMGDHTNSNTTNFIRLVNFHMDHGCILYTFYIYYY